MGRPSNQHGSAERSAERGKQGGMRWMDKTSNAGAVRAPARQECSAGTHGAVGEEDAIRVHVQHLRRGREERGVRVFAAELASRQLAYLQSWPRYRPAADSRRRQVIERTKHPDHQAPLRGADTRFQAPTFSAG